MLLSSKSPSSSKPYLSYFFKIYVWNLVWLVFLLSNFQYVAILLSTQLGPVHVGSWHGGRTMGLIQCLAQFDRWFNSENVWNNLLVRKDSLSNWILTYKLMACWLMGQIFLTVFNCWTYHCRLNLYWPEADVLIKFKQKNCMQLWQKNLSFVYWYWGNVCM